MKHNWQLPRRTFLKGLGTALALPALEAMVPSSKVLGAGAEGAPGTSPKRMAFVYVPNGANMADWTPKQTGADFELPFILEPLKTVKSEVQVLSGLCHYKAQANGDGGGDHARASATFLTGCQARKTAAVDIRAGVSVDQVAAARLARLTRLPSLELSCDNGRQAGSCDSGYSCAYQFNLAWRTETTPLPPEVNPKSVFERLFGHGPASQQNENRALREKYNKSILDFVMEDAKQLQRKLGTTDRRKLDDYMTSVREVEQRIEMSSKFSGVIPEFKQGAEAPKDYEAHIRLMYDLLVLAFQTDTTRVSTFIMAHDGSNRSYPFIGVSDGHHDLSHHQGNEEKKQKIAKINRFHISQFAYFLQKLKSAREGEGSLLDQCMIVYGSGIADGNAHAHHDLPVLLAGKAGGGLSPGRHILVEKKTPMTNLYLSMLDLMGTPVERLGDSTGKLPGLS
jgi:hypothetical protein